MDEKRIQQVLEIEKQAQELRAAAVREAQQLPLTADQEAQALIEKARNDAQAEARHIIASAQTGDETALVLAEVEEKNRQLAATAKKNFDHAVTYVLDRVIGRG